MMNPIIKLVPLRNQSTNESNNNSFDGMIKALRDIYRSSARHLRKLESNLFLRERKNSWNLGNLGNLYSTALGFKFKRIKCIPSNQNLESKQGLKTFHSLNEKNFFNRTSSPNNFQKFNNFKKKEDKRYFNNLNTSQISKINSLYDYYENSGNFQTNWKNIKNIKINKTKKSIISVNKAKSGVSPYITRMTPSFYKKLIFPISNPEHYFQNNKCDYFLLHKKRRLAFNYPQKYKNFNTFNNFHPFNPFNPLNNFNNFQNVKNNNNFKNLKNYTDFIISPTSDKLKDSSINSQMKNENKIRSKMKIKTMKLKQNALELDKMESKDKEKKIINKMKLRNFNSENDNYDEPKREITQVKEQEQEENSINESKLIRRKFTTK